jgi:uncharacterized protein (DUF362 family)
METPKISIETGVHRRENVKAVIKDLGDIFISRVKEANTIFIKVNLVHHEHQLATTHVDAVRATLDKIREHTNTVVQVGDASYSGTAAAFRNFGYHRLLEEYQNVELVDLNEGAFVEGRVIQADRTPRMIHRAKVAVSADLKISISPMKIDDESGVSLSIKNWVMGTWMAPSRISAYGRVWARWPFLDEPGSYAHHASLKELYKDAPCDLAIIDGTVAMEGKGPVHGKPVAMNVVLASFDPLAADAVATTLMGIEAEDIGYLALAAEEDLGAIRLVKMVLPPALIMDLTRDFARPIGFHEFLQKWRGGLDDLQPVVIEKVLGGFEQEVV